ncbi:hypothetical protein [Clostridium tarantellae]|uniref:Uncharacterized protein n=1 Tax=Clostridium tarantellae TaxID=39493 RepID=A0A6I1MQA6_9CLOT|nr:hypothetical protein [Clostridium tarantellae]MPQ45003.1 hypothetical protein [Clostridium tarantellae]
MKKFKTLSILIILLLISIGIILFPYKLTELSKKTKENEIRLELKYTPNETNKDLVSMKDSKEIKIIGNTPFKSVSTFIEGDSKYNNFIAYGKFIDEKDEEGNKIFNITKWFPEKSYVPFIDSMFAFKYYINLILPVSVIFISFLIILIASLKLIKTLNKK